MRPWNVVVLALACPLIAEARETGDLRGVIDDEAGDPVPGATLTLSGPELAGTRTRETDDRGAYAFDDLTPGTYQLDVGRGGRVFLTAEVTVGLDRATWAPFVVKLDADAPVIVVEGVRPAVDTSSAALSTTLNQNYLQDLPTGRTYQDAIATLPGVSGRVDTESGAVGDGNPSVRGEGRYGNSYTVDGINTRDASYNTFGARVNYDAIQEISVYTDGAPAEYGQFTGLAANIVTKDGGDEHHGSVAAFYTQHAFFDQTYPIFDAAAATDVDALKARLRMPEFNATAGGPLIKEKLWYFVAADAGYRWAAPDGLPNERALQRSYGQAWAKLTWFPSSAWVVRAQVSAWGVDEPKTNAGPLVAAEATNDLRQTGLLPNLRATWTPNADTYVDLRLGWLRATNDLLPTSRDLDTPSYIDGQGLLRGNSGNYDYNTNQRLGGGFTVAQSLHDAIGEHRLKFGVEYWHLGAVRDVQPTGLVDKEWIDAQGTPTGETVQVGTQYLADPGLELMCEAADHSDCARVRNQQSVGPLGSNVHTVSAFLQDEWHPDRRLTVAAGFRFDAEQGFTNDGVPPLAGKVSEFALDDAQKFVGRSPIRMMPAPRLGVSLDPSGDKKTRIFGNYGWYYDIADSWYWSWANTRNASGYMLFGRDGAGGEQWEFTQDPASNPARFDVGLDPHRVEKLVIGVEREVLPRLIVSVRGITSRTRNLAEDIETDFGQWYVVNTPMKWRAYQGLEVAVQRGFSDRLQVQASYTLSASTGTSPGQFERPSASLWGSAGNGIGVYLDDVGEQDSRQALYDAGLGWLLEGFKGTGRVSVTDPDYRDSAGYDGYLPYHSLHMLKLNGSYRFPFGTLVGVVAEVNSGLAWQKMTMVPFYGFSGMAEGRGSRSTPPAAYLDVRLAHQLPLTGAQSLELTADVFNLPGFATPIDYFDNDAAGFGSVLARQAPRQVRVGAKYRW